MRHRLEFGASPYLLYRSNGILDEGATPGRGVVKSPSADLMRCLCMDRRPPVARVIMELA